MSDVETLRHFIRCASMHVSGYDKAYEALDRLAKDVERYRWLRDPNQEVASVLDKDLGYVPPDEFGGGGYRVYEYRAGEELDAAIDAARKS